MSNIHNYERTFDRYIERVSTSEEISPKNKSLILGFKDHLLSIGIGFAKINRYLGDLIKLNRMLKKDFDTATKLDIKAVVSEINQGSLSAETKRCFRIMLRKFYCYLRGYEEKGVYPEEVKWMKMEYGQNQKKLPEELITEEEIKNIVNACTNIRDKALIATLSESGCRVSEIGTMNIKHVSFESQGARLTVRGKTGTRKILVITSAPYLQQWINSHPYNYLHDSPLWYNYKTEFLSYTRITAILKRAAKNAGVNKRIHPHLLRHSRATQLANIMSDSQMKHYLGWTQSSKMAGIYVHMSGKDTDDAILKVNKIEKIVDVREPLLKPLSCARCNTANPSTNRFCNLCGLVLDPLSAQEILRKEHETSDMSDVLQSLLKDKDVLALLSKKLKGGMSITA